MRLVSALCCVALLATVFGCESQQPTAAEPGAAEVGPETIGEVAEPTSEPGPPAAAEPGPPAPPPAETTYVVQPGDTLWSIAQQLYGDGKLWEVIHEANRDRIPSVSAMKVGTELRIPAVAPE